MPRASKDYNLGAENPDLASAKDRRELFSNYSRKGVSTGCLGSYRNDWPQMIKIARGSFRSVIELSALSENELPGLVRFASSASSKDLPFEFISVHAPTKNLSNDELGRIKMIAQIAPYVDRIVFHPDTIKDPGLYQFFGNKIAIENMDSRKNYGQSVEDLAQMFSQIPKAMFCFDLAHMKTVDDSLELGWSLAEEFSSRISHLHLSSIDSDGHHIPLQKEDEVSFAPFLDRFRTIPWILEDFDFDSAGGSL